MPPLDRLLAGLAMAVLCAWFHAIPAAIAYRKGRGFLRYFLPCFLFPVLWPLCLAFAIRHRPSPAPGAPQKELRFRCVAGAVIAVLVLLAAFGYASSASP